MTSDELYSDLRTTTDRPLVADAGASLPTPLEEAGDGEVSGELLAPRSARRGLSTFARSRQGVAGLVVIVVVVLFCFLGPVFYHTNQATADLSQAYLRPSASHLLGTDQAGYDQLGRLMVGGQSSLEVGVAAALLSTVFGSLYGALAGYIGGVVDAVMMRVVDGLLAIPGFILLILLASMFHTTKFTMIGIIAFFAWLPASRLIRGQTLSLRTREYVQVASAMGAKRRRIIIKHILPNTLPVLIVHTTLLVAEAILLLAALGFLGFGVEPPQTDWGAMLNNGVQLVNQGYWWLIYPPGLAIIILVISIALVNDAVQASFDLRVRRR